VISPDGKKLAFMSNATGVLQIYVVEMSTGTVVQLIKLAQYGFQPIKQSGPEAGPCLFRCCRRC